jgi:predicted O-linked N-acetylglucosamine transferase (SPINDLY family)
VNLTLIAALVSAGIAGLAGWTAAWQIQAGKLTEVELSHANERIAIQRAARASLERVTGQISQAQASAQRRLAVVERDRSGAVGELERLRDTATATVRAAADTPATCERIAATQRDILAESSSFIQALAADADQCGVERQALIEGWPR